MKIALSLISLILFSAPLLYAKECGKMSFHFNIIDRKYTKDVQLCRVRSDRDIGFVSSHCIDRKCPVLKTQKVLMKKEKFAVNKIKKLCESLKGIYLQGFLEGSDFSRTKTLCFFKNGTIVSGGYLYYALKDRIEFE